MEKLPLLPGLGARRSLKCSAAEVGYLHSNGDSKTKALRVAGRDRPVLGLFLCSWALELLLARASPAALGLQGI